MAYNVLSPTPLSGQGAFGMVPGLTPTPQPAQDLAAQFPNLSGVNAAMSSDIQAGLAGQTSPATTNALRDASTRWGWASGMPALDLPGSLNWHNLYGNIAGFAEQQKQLAMQNYASIIPTISKTQTVSPELQAEIASQNALNLAAPNPQQAASYAQSLFDKYLARTRGGGYPSYQGGPSAPTTTGTTGPTTGRFYDPNAPVTVAHGPGWGTPDTPTPATSPWTPSSWVPGTTGMSADERDWITSQGFDPSSFGQSRTQFLTGPGGTEIQPPVTPYSPMVGGLPFAQPYSDPGYSGIQYSGVTPYSSPPGAPAPVQTGLPAGAGNFNQIMGIDPTAAATGGGSLMTGDPELDQWISDTEGG
jgi:hypothetical protein